MTSMLTSKHCSGCNRQLDVNKFVRRSNGYLVSKCKECQSEKYKKYYNENRETLLINCIKRYHEKKDTRKDKRNATQKSYYHKASDKYKHRARVRKQNLKIKNELLPGEWEKLVERCGNVCIVPGCSNSPVTRDHVIPISKGGRHHISNLQPLCLSHNIEKGISTKDYRK